ncbi:hypothetical protein CUMW_120920 [Citrus unshiu]|nr:hypothetical protein CUMW_120920 [Citrus unshiu]
MGSLVFRLFRFHPPDEEEIIKLLLNKRRLDPDFYVQTDKKHRAECVVYGFHFRNHVAENTFPKVRKNKTCGRYEISTYERGVAETVFGTNATLPLALISGRIPTVTKSQFKFVL